MGDGRGDGGRGGKEERVSEGSRGLRYNPKPKTINS